MRTLKRLLGAAAIGCLMAGVALYAIPLPAGITPTLSPVVNSAEGVLLRAYLNREDKWRFPVVLDELPPFFVNGLLCEEASFLYLLPQAPARWTVYSPQLWQEARQRVLDRLARCRLLTAEEVRQAGQAPLPTVRHPFPLHAVHFADYLRQQFPQHDQLTTTIAMDVQRLLEQLVGRWQGALAVRGIHNIAMHPG
ncbi:MAG: hypothetical protein HYZ81_08815 [Nitrospinae bacterium]|nr:hypothetical protein [Nitrospinota bacterium]